MSLPVPGPRAATTAQWGLFLFTFAGVMGVPMYGVWQGVDALLSSRVWECAFDGNSGLQSASAFDCQAVAQRVWDGETNVFTAALRAAGIVFGNWWAFYSQGLLQLLVLVIALWLVSYLVMRRLLVGKHGKSEALIHIYMRLPLRMLGALLIVVGLLAGFYYCMISEARLVFAGAQGPAEASQAYGKAFADVVRKTFGAFGKAFTV